MAYYVELTELEQNGTATFKGVNGMNEEVSLTFHLNRFKAMPISIRNSNGRKMIISNVKRANEEDIKKIQGATKNQSI